MVGGERRLDKSEEHLTDVNGVRYVRKELNGHWVRYTYLGEDGSRTKQVAMPRIEVFTAEDIANFDQMFAAEELGTD